MKNVYSILITALLSLFLFSKAYGQDVAVAGFNYDTNDGFTLVALVDIPATQNIFVTDSPYQPGTNSFDGTASANEGTLRITWTGTWMKGTIIEVEETSPSTFTVTSSTNGPAAPAAAIVYTAEPDGFSLSNDGMSVFTASSTTDPDNTVTEIYSFVSHDASGADPDPNTDMDCPCSTAFVSVDLGDFNADHGEFNPPTRSGAVSLADYNNPANWNTSINNVNLSQAEFTNLTFGGSGLPVVLTYFTATAKEKESLLQWQTSSEIENHYFQVEHSIDGRDFIAIDQVLGNGNSFETINYVYIDAKPMTGVNYYRLKQVDYNGQFEYSEIVSVEFRQDNQTVSIYPNPFDRSVTLEFPASENSLFTDQDRAIEVLDIHGRLIHSIVVPMEETIMKLNLSTLIGGTYFIRTMDENQGIMSTQRVVKLR